MGTRLRSPRATKRDHRLFACLAQGMVGSLTEAEAHAYELGLGLAPGRAPEG
jgi:hypothetical protein